MKSYTDLEQSRKLAEILPLESADMIYIPMMDIDSMSNSGFFDIPECYPFNEFKDSDTKPLPYWSLAALLEYMNRNFYNISLNYCGSEYTISFDDSEKYKTITKDYSIDAVFEMVIWLKENNRL